MCLCLATVVTAVWSPWATSSGLPGWAGALPVLVAVSLIAVVANISAVRRLRFLARGASRREEPPGARGGAPALATDQGGPRRRGSRIGGPRVVGLKEPAASAQREERLRPSFIDGHLVAEPLRRFRAELRDRRPCRVSGWLDEPAAADFAARGLVPELQCDRLEAARQSCLCCKASSTACPQIYPPRCGSSAITRLHCARTTALAASRLSQRVSVRRTPSGS